MKIDFVPILALCGNFSKDVSTVLQAFAGDDSDAGINPTIGVLTRNLFSKAVLSHGIGPEISIIKIKYYYPKIEFVC